MFGTTLLRGKGEWSRATDVSVPATVPTCWPFPQGKKGKAVPLQAWTGPEGSIKLRLPDFVTTAQDGGKVVSLTHRPP